MSALLASTKFVRNLIQSQDMIITLSALEKLQQQKNVNILNEKFAKVQMFQIEKI